MKNVYIRKIRNFSVDNAIHFFYLLESRKWYAFVSFSFPFKGLVKCTSQYYLLVFNNLNIFVTPDKFLAQKFYEFILSMHNFRIYGHHLQAINGSTNRICDS